MALTAYELVTLRRMVQSALRKSERRTQRNEETGRELPGADANALRAERLAALDAKLREWLEDTWPAVDEARKALRGYEPDDAEVEREAWLAESRLEGARLAAQADA